MHAQNPSDDSAPNSAGELRIITIDGPAGCGKSTVVRLLSSALTDRGTAAVAFSSGLIYRGLTWAVLEAGIDPSDRDSVRAHVSRVDLQIVSRGDSLRAEVGGIDPADELHSTRVTESIHWIADDPEIRRQVLTLQRALPGGPVILAEGRDLGTVVYPDAPLKVFLTASLAERARRRHAEFRERLGEEISLEEVEERLRIRDEHDSSREVAPLRPAEDAVTIDTTELTPEKVVAEILAVLPSGWSVE